MRIDIRESQEFIGGVTVELDGVDVTNDCEMADEEAGEVRLIVRRSDGHIHVDEHGKIPRRACRGKVRILPLSPEAVSYWRKRFAEEDGQCR